MKNWIKAARLRTLPLSLSGIIMGSFIARWRLSETNQTWDWKIFALAILVTLLYQVLSNFANDYGDAQKGTDAVRSSHAEARTVASGKISLQQMKKAVMLTSFVSLLATVGLLWVAFIPNHLEAFFVFIGLGLACVLVAIGYTMGKKPYGYMGLGDIMVFIFFGLVSVCGSYFLFTKNFDWDILLPATAIGMMSTAVLNLNNMRDSKTDKLTGKKSLALRMGYKNAMIYEMVLLNLPLLIILVFLGVNNFLVTGNPKGYYPFIVLILMFPLAAIRRKILQTKEPENLDPFLKQVGIITLMMSILLAVGLNMN